MALSAHWQAWHRVISMHLWPRPARKKLFARVELWGQEGGGHPVAGVCASPRPTDRRFAAEYLVLGLLLRSAGHDPGEDKPAGPPQSEH